MAERTGQIRIRSLQRQWKVQSIVFCLLLALSVSLLIMALLYQWASWRLWYGIFILAVCLPLALLRFPYWRVTARDIARFLDKHFPELEESCGLLLRPVQDLGPLEKLQAARTEARLLPIRPPRPLQKKLNLAVCLLGVVCLICAGSWYANDKGHTQTKTGIACGVMPAAAEKAAPGIRSVSVRITPPAYTGRAVREQHSFDLKVEEGALLSWQLQTTVPVKTLQLIVNDTVYLSLKAEDPEHTRWQYTGAVLHPGFYQVRAGDWLSELYKIEVIRDEAPHIEVRTPKAYTVVEYGESPRVPLSVRVQDDYGIADATVVATIASGSGEAVKFKEQTIRFDRAFTGNHAVYDLEKIIDLPGLGLRPGDELYFYVRAKDNHEQESRSDMYIISLPDTAQLMSLEGLTTGVNIKPEYFRSERQIILETEQLLKEKDTISVAAFHTRSNDLGIDQKLLRLRYGKFLGEEAEEGDPFSDHGDGKDPGGKTDPGNRADLGGPGDFGNAAKILDAFTDKHDKAEDASFFEPGVKAQLKATLTEMWNAELRLRVFNPREALPYAYKALRLLKDLQQKSRAYVAKTGVRVTPLDPAKRLSGKLEEIGQPVRYNVEGHVPDPADVLRVALALLDRLGTPGAANGESERGTGNREMSRASMGMLEQAGRQLGKEAAEHPGEYLAAYQSIRRILQGQAGDKDIILVQQAIRKLVPEAEQSPSPGKAPADAGLSKLYYQQMKRMMTWSE